jgi:ADP-dependent phosphofructokinase/glucokinase
MILGSHHILKQNANVKEKRYHFEMSEKEFENLQDGQTLTKHVEWAGGRGKFELKFIRKTS